MRKAAAAFCLVVCSAFAGSPYEFWPGTQYDARIPTFRGVLGYEAGERITRPADLLRYLDALAGASARIKIFPYAESWEGRKLVYAAVGSEVNLKRLPEIRAAMQKLADPRKTPPAEAQRLMAWLPAVIWLAHGVHGNEISPSESALLTAYHLLAARGEKMADRILADVVVLIDPLQNPDGRERFVHSFEQTTGPEPDPSPAAAEHSEPWPTGRGNHYLFDLNRDWFALSQPETRGRVKAMQEWYPLVFTDLHEMSANSTYFFGPEADPYNPHLAKDQRDSLQLFGRNNAQWFDHFGFDYFTREQYDAFYPGYGASWPSYYGSVAMTYEQATVRGLLMRRSDGTVAPYREGIRHHFVASLATAETAARHREKLLEDFYRYRQSAIDEGAKEAVREYILPRGRDGAATDKLVALLMEQGVEVDRAAAPFRSGGREFPMGTYVAPLAQPAKRLMRTLLDASVAMDDRFLAEQERRRSQKLPHQIYDVTAWSLPLLFNVECVAASQRSSGKFERAAGSRIPAGTVLGEKAKVAYLAPWGSASSGRLLTAALRAGLRVHSTDRGFSLLKTNFPAGTLVFKVQGNPSDLEQRLRRLAELSGADIQATDTSWVGEGVNFGSRSVAPVRKPAIALAWDSPVSAASAGAARFALERQLQYPVTLVRVAQLATADLSRFHVLVLPDEGADHKYSEQVGEKGIARITDWVNAGGTLIAIGEAVSFLASEDVELLDVAPESAVKVKPGLKPERVDGRLPGRLLRTDDDYRAAIQAQDEQPDAAPGAILAARINPDHWLTAGMRERVHVLTGGRGIFTPIRLDKGVNAAVFLGAGEVVASGYLWKENREQIANKPLAVVQKQERGLVIGITADPNYRGFTDGASLLFLNAVFRGPSHAGSLPSDE